MRSGIKVFAPASVSNVACGFDLLGFALEEPGDEVVVRFADKPGIQITKITGAQGKLPYETDKNTAGVAAQKLLDFLGEKTLGIELELHKKMPIGSGLGSSAASAVAAVFAVNELLKHPLEKRDLLPFAAEAEKVSSGAAHLDNVAPSLIGGMVLVQKGEKMRAHRLPTPAGLFAAVVHPEVEILTKNARQILHPFIPLEKHVEQSGYLGSLIIGLYQSDLELISRSLQDVIIEPQRAPLIPHFFEVKEAALNQGALGCSISGSGPSIFALCPNSHVAQLCGEAMARIYDDAKIAYQIYLSPINQEGVVKC
ncbi:MAG: homoserine kinase [Saprospirales bacterium]|nr:homoserine kinase [Saprospirales bacterium]MBK8489988.1 homoserine kinase [Saprospirales bacterium]